MSGYKILVTHRTAAGQTVWTAVPLYRMPLDDIHLAEIIETLAAQHEANWGHDTPRDHWTWTGYPLPHPGWPTSGITQTAVTQPPP